MMLDENAIKSILISYLYKKKILENSVLFSEMVVAKHARVLDLGYLKDGRLTAIEIKSDKDNLYRLAGQVEEYLKYFDRVIVCVTEKFVVGSLEIISEEVELWSVSAAGVRIVKRGKLNKIEKSNYIDLMSRNDLNVLGRMLGIRVSDYPVFELRQLVLSGIDRVAATVVKSVVMKSVEKRFRMASIRFFENVVDPNNIQSHELGYLSVYK